MKLITAGLILIFIGFALLFLGMLQSPSVPSTSSNTQFAGIILLGPIPIAFGNVSPNILSNLVIVGVVFSILVLIIYLIMFIIARKSAKYPPT
ncbi:MAG: DUF131 domain-containing protein [Saccharolobus sp.]